MSAWRSSSSASPPARPSCGATRILKWGTRREPGAPPRAQGAHRAQPEARAGRGRAPRRRPPTPDDRPDAATRPATAPSRDRRAPRRVARTTRPGTCGPAHRDRDAARRRPASRAADQRRVVGPRPCRPPRRRRPPPAGRRGRPGEGGEVGGRLGLPLGATSAPTAARPTPTNSSTPGHRVTTSSVAAAPSPAPPPDSPRSARHGLLRHRDGRRPHRHAGQEPSRPPGPVDPALTPSTTTSDAADLDRDAGALGRDPAGHARRRVDVVAAGDGAGGLAGRVDDPHLGRADREQPDQADGRARRSSGMPSASSAVAAPALVRAARAHPMPSRPRTWSNSVFSSWSPKPPVSSL